MPKDIINEKVNLIIKRLKINNLHFRFLEIYLKNKPLEIIMMIMYKQKLFLLIFNDGTLYIIIFAKIFN